MKNPDNFEPTNSGEYAAFEAWKKLENKNPLSFYTTYLRAHIKGLPDNRFFQFVSEILQDKTIKNKGAVFNKKAKEYFDKYGVKIRIWSLR